jgi:hypothetical protein
MQISRVLLPVVAAITLAPGLVVAGTASAAPSPAAQARQPAACFERSVPPTVEQARVQRPAPQRILGRSGADRRVERFARSLCRARSEAAAARVVDRHGHRLWTWATGRAQGRIPVAGSLPGGDDRPLYWARVAMTRLVDTWTPTRGSAPSANERARLVERLETTSRGQDTLRPHRRADGRRTKAVVVTGFDPFTLDVDSRIGNPSGAVALALDGRRLRTRDGWVRVETAVFPVRWDDFTDGEVERTLAPFVRRGARGLDALVTVSQGRPDQFDLEVWNGAHRGGFADNENLERTGTIPVPAGYPTVTPQPQFTRTDLPVRRMKARDTGRYRVRINHEITERDPATGEERTHTDGPTPGWEALVGSPGDYLSNEIAYRATLLRDGARAPNVGGHVHTPVLGVPHGRVITDRGFVRRRDAIVAQTRALVRASVGGRR